MIFATMTSEVKNTTTSGKNIKMATKGKAIRFVGGKYQGKVGWMNASMPSTAAMHNVIIKEDDDVAFTARVMKTSVADLEDRQPSSKFEACLIALPEIEKLFEKLADKLTMCDIDPAAQTIKKVGRLCLCTNAVSDLQWKDQFQVWTINPDENFAVFTSDRKDKIVDPCLLVTTYTMIRFSGKRSAQVGTVACSWMKFTWYPPKCFAASWDQSRLTVDWD
jgi:hypothetical protein